MILSKTTNPSNENLRFRAPLFWLYAIAMMISVCANSGCDKQSKASAATEELAEPVGQTESVELTESVDEEPEASPFFRQDMEVHPDAAEFSQHKRAKNHTIFVLALDSVARENYFTSMYHSLDPQQVERVSELIDSYSLQYSKLLKERSVILEHAVDGDNSEIALTNVYVETLLLNQLIRTRIRREIMTQQQRDEFNEQFEEKTDAENETVVPQEKDS